MIAPLRRRHRIIWRALVPLLFAGAVSGYLLAPKYPTDQFGESRISYPQLLRSVVSENYMFDLRNGYGGESILEVKQISAINPVSELVTIRYRKATGIEVTQELGMMGGRKKYSFNLKAIQPPFSVTVTDTIKKITLANIDF
jgi:hypothetical protein